MRLLSSSFSFLLIFAAAFVIAAGEKAFEGETEKENKFPSDWFYRQRAYPLGYINDSLRKVSLEQARLLQSVSRSSRNRAQLRSALWRSCGPSNIGGRITTMAISRQNPNLLYIGAADGGVLRSINGGVNWTPLFDEQPSLSIGAIAVDPSDDNIVYVGTGEVNSSGDSYDGSGMVKSTDGGVTWFSLGLEQTRHIGKIVIDPVNPLTLYVASMGTLFTGNEARGVYKSIDGGATWTNVLFINDSTGVVDLAINPLQPNVLFAAAWQRMRTPQGRLYVGGVGTGIYRTTDAGATWTLLSNGLPVPTPDVGRPGIAVAPSIPLVAYACFADNPGSFLGVFKSTNGGDTWSRVNDGNLSSLYSTFGWYFGKIYVHPANENVAFVLGVSLATTVDGGSSWQIGDSPHVDNHAMAFHPSDPDRIYIGNDGGFGWSVDGGATWSRMADQDLFVTQFYAGWISTLNPANILGGTQDNGTVRTQTGKVSDWGEVNGGDGFYCIVDYSDTNYQYAEFQYGGLVRTTDGWRTNGFDAKLGIDPNDRTNWSAPLVIDPKNPLVLYTGTHRLYKTSDRAAHWTPVSPDLTNGPFPGFGAYATVTTIDVAPTDTNTIIVGTDDANIWVTTDAGSVWNKVSATLPNRWITRVRFDPTDRHIAYVTLSGYRVDSKLPHIFRTTDLGSHWQDISSNLPEAPVNVVLVDPRYPNRLYVGTDVGAYYTTDTGTSWSSMGTGLPNAAINDMQLHAGTRIVRAFTHGRSAWELNLDDLLVAEVAEREQEPFTFEVAQNYPNPFNPATTIEVKLSHSSAFDLTIYDVSGRRVRTLEYGKLSAGSHTLVWNGRNDSGHSVSSGVYLCRARAGKQTITRRMLLLR